jgi:hypothetical protein
MTKAPDKLTTIHALPVLVGHLGGRPVDGDPGVIHQDVEAPVLIYDVMHDAPAVVSQADVAFVQRAELVGKLCRHGRLEFLRSLTLTPVASRDRCTVGRPGGGRSRLRCPWCRR